MGKGDRRRPGDVYAFRARYDRITWNEDPGLKATRAAAPEEDGDQDEVSDDLCGGCGVVRQGRGLAGTRPAGDE